MEGHPSPEPRDHHPGNLRTALAERITAALLRRHRREIHAVGASGSVAHHDDVDGSDLAITVVTYRAGGGPPPTARRIDGIVVDIDVLSADGLLAGARALTPSWPLIADRYLTALPLHDPGGWHDRLRDTHLAHLVATRDGEFAVLARHAWCRASAARGRAIRLAERHDTDGAVLTLGEARLSAALAEGLLTRTYFRSTADALQRTGLGDAGMTELARRLGTQATRLAERGHPVDGTLDEL